MFNLLLMSIIMVPVLAGVVAASKGRRSTTALLFLIGFTVLYSLFYMFLLYYVRIRWVG